VTVELPKGPLELLERPSLCYLATLMPDGSPHLTRGSEAGTRFASCCGSSPPDHAPAAAFRADIGG
jgi:hypothetical protein